MRVARRGGRGGLTWPGVGALVGSPGGGRKAEREAALGECGWHPRDRGQAAWPFLSPACSPHHAPSPPPPPRRSRLPPPPSHPPPTPRVVLARIPAFLFRLTSPPRRREAGPRVDPGLFGGGPGRALPPHPPARLCLRSRGLGCPVVFSARLGMGFALPPPALGRVFSRPLVLHASAPLLRSCRRLARALSPCPRRRRRRRCFAVGAVVGRRPSGSRVTGRQCHVRPAFRGRAARRTEFVTRRQGRRSLGAPGCGAFPPSLPRLARLPLSRYLARPGAEV